MFFYCCCATINMVNKDLQKSLSVKAVWCTKAVGLSKFPDTDWKLESIDSLLKRIHKTGKIVWQPVSSRPPSSRKGVFIATKLNSTQLTQLNSVQPSQLCFCL